MPTRDVKRDNRSHTLSSLPVDLSHSMSLSFFIVHCAHSFTRPRRMIYIEIYWEMITDVGCYTFTITSRYFLPPLRVSTSWDLFIGILNQITFSSTKTAISNSRISDSAPVSDGRTAQNTINLA